MAVQTPQGLATEIAGITDGDSLHEMFDADLQENVKIKHSNLFATPSSNDISSSAQSITLPAASSSNGKEITAKWYGGNGSFKFTINTSGADTIDGISSTLWEGEGSGSITIKSDGVSDWIVTAYKDIIQIADSGTDLSRTVEKCADGSAVIDGFKTITFSASTNINVVANFGYTFNTIVRSKCYPLLQFGVAHFCVSGPRTTTTTTIDIHAVDVTSAARTGSWDAPYKVQGTWR